MKIIQETELPEFIQVASEIHDLRFEIEKSCSRTRNNSFIDIKRRKFADVSLKDRPEPKVLIPSEQKFTEKPIKCEQDLIKNNENNCRGESVPTTQVLDLKLIEEFTKFDEETLRNSGIEYSSMEISPKADQKTTSEQLNLSTHEEKTSEGIIPPNPYHLPSSNCPQNRLKQDFVQHMTYGTGADLARGSFMSKVSFKECERRSVQKPKDLGGDTGTEIGCAGKLEKACRLI